MAQIGKTDPPQYPVRRNRERCRDESPRRKNRYKFRCVATTQTTHNSVALTRCHPTHFNVKQLSESPPPHKKIMKTMWKNRTI